MDVAMYIVRTFFLLVRAKAAIVVSVEGRGVVLCEASYMAAQSQLNRGLLSCRGDNLRVSICYEWARPGGACIVPVWELLTRKLKKLAGGGDLLNRGPSSY